MAETNKRQEVVNHIKLLNQHKQPILDENKNPVVIDQKISLDTESKHFIDFKGSFTNESGKETKSVLTVDKDQSGNFSIGIPNLNLFVSGNGETLASVLGAEGNSISLTPLNTPPSKIATFQNGDETCFEILAESGQVLLITTNGNSVSIQTKENENAPAKDFIYQVEKGSGLDIDMQPEAVEAFFDPSNEFFHTDIKQITDFPTNILAMYAKLKTGVNEQTRIGKFTMTVISQNENAEPFFFMTRHSQRANAQDNNYLLFENKFYSVEKLLFQKDPTDGKLRMVFQIQPRTGNKKSETNKRAVAYDLEVDENGKLTPESLKVVNYMRNVCGYAEPTTHNEGDIEVETDDGKIVFEQKDRRDYSNYQYYVASNNSNRTVFTEDQQNGKDGNGRDNGEDNSLNPPPNDIEEIAEQEQPEEKKEKPAPKPAEAPPAEKNFTKLADAFGTAFAYLGVFIAIGAILIPGFAALAIVGCIVSLAGVTTSTLSDKFKFTPFKAAEKKIKELEDQEKEDKEFEEDFLSNEKDLDKAADLTDAKAKELNDYLREFYTDPNNELSQFTGIFEEYGIGFSDIKDAERAKPAEERNNYARTEAMVGRDGLEIRRQMATDLRNIQTSQDATARAQMIDQFIDTNFRPMPQPVRTALLDNLFGGGTEGNDRLTAFVTKLEETVSYGDQERKILDIQHKAIDNAKDSSVNRLINSSKINADQRARIVKRYSHQLVRRYANDQNMNEEKLNKTLEKLPEEEQQVIIDTLINAQEQIEQETAHIEAVAHDNRELVANANEAGRYIKAVYAIENGPVNTYNEATSAVIDMLKERTALAHKTSISIASIREATKNAQKDLDVNSSAYKIVEHTAEMLGSFSNMASSKEVSTSYKNMMNILFTEFPEVASSYLGNDIPAPTGNKQHNIDQMIENIAACPGEKADKLKTALETYRNARKTAGSVMRTHLSKPLESILAQVFTKDIRDTLQTDEARAAFNARITKKITELNKESFFRNHIYNDKNAQLHTRLATAIMLIEDKLSDKNLPDKEKAALSRTLKSMTSVVNGTLAEVALESCVITAIDGKSGVKHDEKTLEEKTNVANDKIKGYKRALDIITNMKLPTEKDENGKTATQRIIESFKAITSVKDASATTQLLNILNETVVGGEKLGSKAIEENAPSFKEIYEASRMTSDLIGKKVDKLGNLSQAEKDSVKAKIQTAYEVIAADPKSSRKDIETAIKAAFGNSGLDKKLLNKIKKDIEGIAKYGAQPIDIQQAEKQIRDKIQSLNKRATKEVHCHDERVGQAQAEREYAHHRSKLSRKDKDFAYETVYDMIFALADKEKFKEEYNKTCEESEKITNEEELLAKLQEDIDKQSKKLAPKKLAARYGISKETYAKKENKLQIYENVYELLEAITPEKTAEEVEEIIRTEFLKNPKISPAKLAKTLKIPKAFFKDSLAQLSSRGVSEEGQKKLWLKKKEMDEFNDVADEFTTAWKKLVEAESAEELDNNSLLAIEAFVENAKNESYRRAERAKEHKENLKGATGAEKSRRKKENKADERANKKKGKERKAVDERATHYADVLARIGLNIDTLDKIVKEAKSSDPATREIAVKQLAEINSTLQPEKKIEGAKLDIQNDYETIAVLNNTQFSNQDKALVSAMQQLDEFVKASEDLTKKLDFLASLQGKYNMPPEMVEKAYAAFAAGDQSFFEQTKVGENGDRLALLIEGAEFSTEDLALLRQLGIKPEELTDSKKRDKKLKDIRKNLELQQQQKQAEVDKAKKVANDNKAGKTSDMSQQSRKKNREGWNFFKKLFGKKKQQVDAKVNEKKAEQARVEEAKKQAEDERNREKPAEKNNNKKAERSEDREAGE